MPDGGLATIIDGALADVGGAPESPTKRKPKPPRKRKRWCLRAMAARIGIGVDTLRRYLRRHPELRRILRHDDPAIRLRDVVTEAEVDEAARFIFSLPWWQWSRRGHKHCVRCKTTDWPHCGNGYCKRCHEWLQRWKRGADPLRYPGAWDQKRGHQRCLVCHRTDVPHRAHGKCTACLKWWEREGLDDKTKTEQRRMCIERRRKLRARAARRRAA